MSEEKKYPEPIDRFPISDHDKMSKHLHDACLLYTHPRGYWKRPGGGYTKDINKAEVWTPGMLKSQVASCGTTESPSNHEILLLEPGSFRVFDMGEIPVLPPDVEESLKLYPENEVFRAKVNAILKKPIPPDRKDWAAIVDWIEHNIVPHSLGATSCLWTAEEDRAPRLEIEIAASRSISGRAHFTGFESGSDTYYATAAEISVIAERSIAVGEADRQDRFLRNLRDHLVSEVYENEPELNWDTENFSYDNERQEGDSGDLEVRTPHLGTLRDYAHRYFETYNPDLGRQLGFNI